MKKLSFKQYVSLAGYAFVFLVSIVAAFQAKGNLLKIVLFLLSSAFSFGLAIDRFISSRKMEKRIQELEDSQLSISVDANALVITEGKKK